MKSAAVFVLAAPSSAQYGAAGGCATCVQTVTKIVDVPQVQTVDRPVPVPVPNPVPVPTPVPNPVRVEVRRPVPVPQTRQVPVPTPVPNIQYVPQIQTRERVVEVPQVIPNPVPVPVPTPQPVYVTPPPAPCPAPYTVYAGSQGCGGVIGGGVIGGGVIGGGI